MAMRLPSSQFVFIQLPSPSLISVTVVPELMLSGEFTPIKLIGDYLVDKPNKNSIY
jgi:hypothetical protein